MQNIQTQSKTKYPFQGFSPFLTESYITLILCQSPYLMHIKHKIIGALGLSYEIS